MIKLKPYERVVIESGVNHYKVVGPGLIWRKPWQKTLTTFSVAPQIQALHIKAVRSVEDIPIDFSLQVLYRVDTTLFTTDLLPNVPGLNESGWQSVLQWRTEAVLRSLLTAYSWCDLKKQAVQQQLQRHLTRVVGDLVQVVGLAIMEIYLLKMEFPVELQESLIQAGRDGVEAKGRAIVLKEYLDIFGANLPEAMPHVLRWELMNLLNKKGHLQLLLATSNLFKNGISPNEGEGIPLVQMRLSGDQNGQNGVSKASR